MTYVAGRGFCLTDGILSARIPTRKSFYREVVEAFLKTNEVCLEIKIENPEKWDNLNFYIRQKHPELKLVKDPTSEKRWIVKQAWYNQLQES